MNPTAAMIDQSWLKRLNVRSIDSDYVFTRCLYWQRGDAEDLAFLYSSKNLTLISCSRDIEKKMVALGKPKSFAELLSLDSEKLEMLEDVDFYRFSSTQIDSQPSIEYVDIDTQKEELQSFIASCPETEVSRAGIELDADHFYVSRKKGEIVGILESYCGIEPFESLAILVHPSHKGRGVGKALISHLMAETKKRNRIIRYRTNVHNIASINLARSLGFIQHSSVQLLYKAD